MPSSRKPKLSMKKAKGVHVYKCYYPSCNNFFTSTSNQSVKYCQNHTHFPTNKHKRSALLLASTLLLSFFVFHPAFALDDYTGHGIGIFIEKSVLLSGDLKYKDLLYLDNSIAKYSGSFIPNGDDIKRQNSPYTNQLGYYRYDKVFRIFIDPPYQIKNNLPLITIVSQLNEFHLPGQEKVTEYKENKDAKANNYIRSYSHTRYMDGCNHATITAKNWKVILLDTIEYMKNKCSPEATKIKTLTVETKPLTKHDIATSQKAKQDSFYDFVKQNCLKSRNACQTVQDKSVTTMRDQK